MLYTIFRWWTKGGQKYLEKYKVRPVGIKLRPILNPILLETNLFAVQRCKYNFLKKLYIYTFTKVSKVVTHMKQNILLLSF